MTTESAPGSGPTSEERTHVEALRAEVAFLREQLSRSDKDVHELKVQAAMWLKAAQGDAQHVEKLGELRDKLIDHTREHFQQLDSLYRKFALPLAAIVSLVAVVVGIAIKVDLRDVRTDANEDVKSLKADLDRMSQGVADKVEAQRIALGGEIDKKTGALRESVQAMLMSQDAKKMFQDSLQAVLNANDQKAWVRDNVKLVVEELAGARIENTVQAAIVRSGIEPRLKSLNEKFKDADASVTKRLIAQEAAFNDRLAQFRQSTPDKGELDQFMAAFPKDLAARVATLEKTSPTMASQLKELIDTSKSTTGEIRVITARLSEMMGVEQSKEIDRRIGNLERQVASLAPPTIAGPVALQGTK